MLDIFSLECFFAKLNNDMHAFVLGCLRPGLKRCIKRSILTSLLNKDSLEFITMTELKSHVLVAALDFGTTFSGYAFSFIHEFKTDPLKISQNIWNTVGLSSYKTPTCLLLDKDKQFVAFGFDAETIYANEVLDGKKEEYYYFYRFKMNLHSNKVSIIGVDMLHCNMTDQILPSLRRIFVLVVGVKK